MPRDIEFHFRLPKDIADQVDKAAERCGMNRTEFIRNACLAEVAEVQEAYRKKRLKPVRSASRIKDTDAPEPVLTEEGPSGLGLEDFLAGPPRHDVTDSTAAPATPDDPVSRLAQAIVDRLERKPEGKGDAVPPTGKEDSQVGAFFQKLSRLL